MVGDNLQVFLIRYVIKFPERQNYCSQAGRRYREMVDWERDDLIRNPTTLLTRCDKRIRGKIVWHSSQCDEDHGRRLADGPGLTAAC